jgi:nicotinamide mononucleotide transporter
MDDVYQSVVDAAQAMSIWEVVGVILGFAYLALIMRQNILGWYAAFGSTAIFSWLFWDVSLVMESGLNVYYLIMAVYGWWVWKSNEAEGAEVVKPIQRWSLERHIFVVSGVVLLSLATGYGLEKNTSAALPYLDSFTTWGAVVTTYMVAQKVLENWLYWLVIDTVAIYLYVDRELYLVAFQMLVYLIMVIVGWLIWQKEYNQQVMNAKQSISK